MFSDIAYLGTVIESMEHGEKVKSIMYNKLIYCNEKSVKYSEFYQAQATGFKPEIVLVTSQFDHNKEKYIRYKNEEYTIIRFYKVKNEKIELVLERGVDSG
ncbi:phage head closure protein [Vallitalea pronyensis]|uniref:Phage head closure protein n=1 Tax=Vallitalea pronyensis TaxID=1348613 RepID=A0A8J8MNV8_9FIRM|nr:phage head closure protein [Vallitalea pronyensis]QUI24876.1 phage head closure protein [Vallitalea pronyensis]